MTRRSRKGLIDDLFHIAARLPWWASAGLAILSFFGLHSLAEQPAPQIDDPTQLGNLVIGQAIRTVAGFGQWLLPIVFAVGAAIAFFKQRDTVVLAKEVRERGPQALGNMSWQQFERVVGEIFRVRGYSVQQRGGNGPDGGVDLVLTRGAEKVLVQCKHWRAQRVGVTVVRELYGAMAAEHAAGGIVVTQGEFTEDAKEFAKGRNLELLNGEALGRLAKQAANSTEPVVAKVPALSDGNQSNPCPTCGADMIQRVAGRGPNAGQRFWGCSRFPKCRGTLPV